MPHTGHIYDMSCWANWANFISQNGLQNVYSSDANYLPLHLYELKMYTLFFSDYTSILSNIYKLKFITLLFDVGGALVVASFVENKWKQSLTVAILLLNPAFIHNSYFWGQFDSVFTFFILLLLISVLRNRIFYSFLFFIIALNFKFQAIVFLPVLTLTAI